MPVMKLVESPAKGRQEPSKIVQSSQEAAPTSADRYVAAVEAEIDGYLGTLRTLAEEPIEEVFLALSSMAARLTEIRVQLVRCDTRRYNALRTRQIDPLLEAIEFQFRVFSRAAAVRKDEMEMSRGQI